MNESLAIGPYEDFAGVRQVHSTRLALTQPRLFTVQPAKTLLSDCAVTTFGEGFDLISY